MDISFFTLQSPIPGKKDTTVNAPGDSSALPKTNFLDFILAQLTEGSKTEKEKPRLLQSDNPVLDPNIDTAEILAVDENIREEIGSWPLDEDSKFWQALALNQEALDAALKPVTNGIITSANVEAGSPRLMQALLVHTEQTTSGKFEGSPALEKLQAIIEKLEKLTNGTEAGGLAITNLTPEQITDLKAKVEALMNEDVSAALTEEQKRKALDGVYLGLIKLLAPNEQSGAAALQAAVDKNKAAMDAKVNNLAAPAKRQAAETPGALPPAQDDAGADQFTNLLKDFTPKKNAPQLDGLKNPGVKPDLSTLQGWPFNMEGSIFAPLPATALPFDQFGAAAGSPFTVTGLGSLTNLVMQTHSASQPHPATQAVAATISKAAADGQTRNITLQLEPPELGRVEIRMSFSKDKTVKAVVVAEKPETLSMLQRDAHSLERALVNSGLEASGSSLGFELAHEGYDFNQQGRDGSSNSYAANDAGAEDIIESTMTWHVDPETGHMRYSILV